MLTLLKGRGLSSAHTVEGEGLEQCSHSRRGGGGA